MVCGIDSYHDATKRHGSVAAFVASINKSLTRWYSKVCFQGPQQELVDGLRTCFISSLKKYYEVCDLCYSFIIELNLLKDTITYCMH